jgi:serine/threonine protein phosphatase PrpC
MRLRELARTDVGRHREGNEDFFLTDPDLGLYVVCDGLGGHADGELAARTGAQALHLYLTQRRATIERFEDTPVGRDTILDLVEGAAQVACRKVFELREGAGASRCATTMTAVLVLGDKAVMAHVGDSRLYLRRAHELHQLSEDHTFFAELKKRGEVVPDRLLGSKYTNVVSRALGQAELVQADTLMFDLLPGDLLLLATDGLTRYYDDNRTILALLNANDKPFELLADRLIEQANALGGKDNVTVIVIAVDEDEVESVAQQDRTETVSMQFNALRYVPLFQFLEHREILRVLSVAESLEVEAGEIIISEGEEDDSMYVTVEGRLLVSRGGTPIAELTRGSHFGEMALLSSRPRSATVQAEEKSKVLVLHRNPLNEVIRQEPQMGVKLLWCLARVLSTRLDDTIVKLSMSTPTLDTIDLSEAPFWVGTPKK